MMRNHNYRNFPFSNYPMLLLIIITAFTPVLPAATTDNVLEQLKHCKFSDSKGIFQQIDTLILQTTGNQTARAELAAKLASLLNTNASYACKQFVCRKLALIGTAKEVPLLGQLLTNDNLSDMARFALEPMPWPIVDKVLLDKLDTADDAIKAGIINTLGNRHSQLATDKLIKELQSDNEELVAAAARALALIGNPQAVQELSRQFRQGTGQQQKIMATACLRCADRLSKSGKRQAAVQIYSELYGMSDNQAIQAGALIGLARGEDMQARTQIIKALSSNKLKLQEAALRIVREIPGEKITGIFVDALPTLPMNTQTLLLDALGDRGDKTALPIIEKFCTSNVIMVRLAAIRALGKLGNSSSVAVLAKWAAQGSKPETRAALNSLVRLRGKNINQAIIRETARNSGAVSAVLISSLAQRQAREAVGMLIEAAKNQDNRVCRAAYKALAILADKNSQDTLIDLLLQADDKNRKLAEKTLVTVIQHNHAEQECSKALIAKLKNADNVGLRCSILRALASLADKSGYQVIRAALADSNQQVRDTAIRSLAAWPTDEPMIDLLKIALEDNSQVHKVLAIQGFVRLVNSSRELTLKQKIKMLEMAMSAADRPIEKKAVISATARLGDIAALELVEPYIHDAALADEASLAAIQISRQIYHNHQGRVNAIMKSIVQKTKNTALKQQAQEVLGLSHKLAGYLLDWEVSGPYMQAGKNCRQLFDIPFAPETNPAAVQWRKMPVGLDRQQPWYLDLLTALNGGEQRVAYLRTTFTWPEDQKVVLEIGSDDGNKVWLNGKVVHANNIMRAYAPAQDQVTVDLKKGRNTLMLKITQNNLPWGASVRIKPITAAREKTGKNFKLHVINVESRFEAAGILDVNRDGKLDIFSGGFWYEAPDWKKHFVRKVKEEGNYYYDFANLPIDIDGDGWVDIANAAWHNRMVFWERNPGSTGGPWEVIPIDTPGNMETALLIDINGDGQPDILPNISNKAAWYEFQRNSNGPHGVKWTRHDLPQPVVGHGMGAGDVNGDGRCDIIGPKGWLQQLPDGTWKWHNEFDLGNLVSIPVLVHDPDGDGDADIIWGNGHGYGVFWLEQGKDASGKRTWKKHEIDHEWSQAHFLLLADLDNDGNQELVTGKRYHAHNGHDPGGNDPLCVYYYSFDKSSKTWQRHLLHEGGQVGFGINTQAKDIDGDGDVDIVTPGKSGLYWFENLLK